MKLHYLSLGYTPIPRICLDFVTYHFTKFCNTVTPFFPCVLCFFTVIILVPYFFPYQPEVTTFVRLTL